MSYKTELASNNTDLEAVLAAVNNLPEAISIDTTLSVAGKAADAKAVGDALVNHIHSANNITSGTFGGQVVANSSGQTTGTSLLRNSKLVSADTTPTVNGEICWTYK